ncbi:MAG: alpha/beta hydrolase [Ilumatobacteraceae bacterium]
MTSDASHADSQADSHAVSDIAVYDFGGSGPTAFYAHATGFHAHCWTSITALLPDLRNVAYDARGHGDTPVGPEWASKDTVDWTVYGSDAAAVAATVQDDGPVLGVGHSMGGAALLMAALQAPERFRGLVVYEPIAMPADVIPSGGQSNFLAMGARKRRSSFPSFADAIANYSAKPPMNVFSPDTMDAYVRYGFAEGEDGQVHLKCRPEHEARTYEAGGNHGTWDRLNDVTVPVWVICGIPQPMQPSARTEELASRIPGARYIQLDHLGHFGPMQAPSEIASIIAEASDAFV